MEKETTIAKSQGIIDLKNEIKSKKLKKAAEEEMKITANNMFFCGKCRGWWKVSFEHEEEVKNDLYSATHKKEKNEA